MSGTCVSAICSIAGTRFAIVMPPASASTSAPGLNSRWTTIVAPVISVPTTKDAAPAWNMGMTISARSCGENLGSNTSIACIALAITAWCAITTPFGSPVVPLVYIWYRARQASSSVAVAVSLCDASQAR